LNVGLKIVKCSSEEFQGAEWEEIYLMSINSDQFKIIEKGYTIFTIYPYKTMYARDHVQVWGTFKRSVLADDFETTKQIIDQYGEIELAFSQNCFLQEGHTIVDTNMLDNILND
tara:strand:- start:499 stop:840 length:342 start_codon:yes stop_codon:yes gene_type:complete